MSIHKNIEAPLEAFDLLYLLHLPFNFSNLIPFCFDLNLPFLKCFSHEHIPDFFGINPCPRFCLNHLYLLIPPYSNLLILTTLVLSVSKMLLPNHCLNCLLSHTIKSLCQESSTPTSCNLHLLDSKAN